MTVRQVFYQATVHNIVEKSEAGYAIVQTDLVQMRRAGSLPYDWLADSTRWMRKPRSFSKASNKPSTTPPASIERRSGRARAPTSRSGSKRMRCRAW